LEEEQQLQIRQRRGLKVVILFNTFKTLANYKINCISFRTSFSIVFCFLLREIAKHYVFALKVFKALNIYSGTIVIDNKFALYNIVRIVYPEVDTMLFI
jgi:hypothetical protein